MHRAAIYCRVSTDLQLSGISLTSQRDQCVDFAARQGWTVVAELIDEGVSGTSADRPGLDELLALCDRRGIDVVVVSRLDRLGRSLRHLATIIGRLDDAGVTLMSVTDGFDSRTATGRLHRNILGSFAEFERELLLERTTGGLRARVGGGWWPTRAELDSRVWLRCAGEWALGVARLAPNRPAPHPASCLAPHQRRGVVPFSVVGYVWL
jgi:site-specific DNA recombinase